MPNSIEEDRLKNCRVIAWQKIDYKCEKCKEENADILFTFSCKGLPKGYVQSGQFVRAWHWKCLPDFLKEKQSTDEQEMWAEATTPFSSRLEDFSNG